MRHFLRLLVPDGVSRHRFVAAVALTFFLMLLVIYGVYFLVGHSRITSYRSKIESSEIAVVNLQKTYLLQSIRRIENDLYYARRMDVMSDFVNADDPSDIEYCRSCLAEEFGKLIKVNPNYDQLRFLDVTGQEIIRANQYSDGVTIVDVEDLQDKSGRYYFTDSMAVGDQDIYQSPMDLNIEGGKIEEPYKAMVRYGVKVFDASGNVRGVILINYNANSLLEDFRQMNTNSEGNGFLLNSKGDYLTGHPTDNFAFMFGDDPRRSFMTQSAEAWVRLHQPHDGSVARQFYTDQGIYTVCEVVPGQGVPSEARWYIVSSISGDNSSYISGKPIARLVLDGYLRLWPLGILVFALAWGVVLALTYRARHLEAIKEMAQIDQLTGAFNRNTGIEVVRSGLEYAASNDMDYTLCFIDLNDLKKVNDQLGHEMGDRFLMDSASVLRSSFRDSDQLVRMGGDEFLIGLHASPVVAEKNWTKVLDRLHELNRVSDRPFDLVLSHGIASMLEDGVEDIKELIALADERMYEEKRRIKAKKG